jgi:PAS domain S-box-containing protein
VEDLRAGVLDHNDGAYQLSIAIRAEKVKMAVATTQHKQTDGEALIVRAVDGTIFYCDGAVEQVYGWDSSEMVGQVSHQILSTEFPAPLALIEYELLANAKWKGELLHSRRDGRQIRVLSEWILRRDRNANPIAVVERSIPAVL